MKLVTRMLTAVAVVAPLALGVGVASAAIQPTKVTQPTVKKHHHHHHAATQKRTSDRFGSRDR